MILLVRTWRITATAACRYAHAFARSGWNLTVRARPFVRVDPQAPDTAPCASGGNRCERPHVLRAVLRLGATRWRLLTTVFP